MTCALVPGVQTCALPTYHLYVAVPEFTGRIGTVKILRRGQTDKEGAQLPLGPLLPLGSDFVSLGQELDHYARLASLPAALRTQIVGFLRDATEFPAHAETSFGEAWWTTFDRRSKRLNTSN